MSKQAPLQAEAPPTFRTPEVPLSPLRLQVSLFAEFLPGPTRLVLWVAPLVLL